MEPEKTDLCTFCARLIPPRKESSPSRAHHPNIGRLERSSQSCSICKTLLRDWSLEKFKQKIPDVDKEAYEALALEVKLKEIRSGYPGLSWGILETNIHAEGYIYRAEFSITTCDAKSISACQPIWRASTTSTPDKILLLKSWLHDCELKHQKCNPLVSRMPKRLIDVGSLDGRPPKLVMSKDLYNQGVRYATLSYCWGNTNFCTTKENESLHKQEIPLQLIPQTLHDALSLTRHLDIQFLWIDALCIVQDNHAEWKIEASRMQEIYSGSSITIAATDADSSSMGCFFPGPSKVDKSSVFLTINNSGHNLGAIVRVQPNDIRTSAEGSVLNTRGWVLQELVLSHRTVHCMRSGLYWECKSECRTETGLVFDRSIKHKSSVPSLPQNIQTGVNKIWWQWIESYSRRRFSFQKDRLPALSGIVQHYQKATGDVPILGLWERSFPQDLLWMRIKKLAEMVEPTPHLSNIPSWTWLSCPYEISFDFWNSTSIEEMIYEDIQFHDHVALVEWAVAWISEPLLSDVKSSRLVLEGPIQEIILSVAPKGKDNNPTYLDVNDEKPDFEKSPLPWRCAGQFDNGPRMTPTKYLCLLLRSAEYKRRGEIYIMETFLIMEFCSGTYVYRRVGLGRFSGERRSFDLTIRRRLNIV